MTLKKIVITLLAVVSLSPLAEAKIGIGVQWGNDFSLHMDDATNEPLILNQLKLNGINGYAGTISGTQIPVYVNRTDWERKPFNLGAKVFIDIIPFIDALELSANFGAWEYKGSITYPTAITYNGTSFVATGTKTMPVTLKEFDNGYLGIKNTPYMKLNFDLTIRKYLVQFPKPLKTIRLYAGGGASLIFATPVLSTKLVNEAIGSVLDTTEQASQLGTVLLGNDKVMKKVVDEIESRLMTPHWGAHIDLGLMIKIPLAPIGIYADGKFMIPFSDIDDSVDIGGYGFLLNTGICLYL